ncbi:cupin domain-containing protein [Ideonella azotifigens]|uniref:Cupin domain-containing protein n=1 Tax=Ideonella azotifigens TaxID=513160 RepID=A0ABP3VPA2_9BURK|nr:cupin domain-containing protein [Ideonella azotifigens]MCD2341183.1 cupin domain-containing protein [Ideonella azotifigens]
MQIRRVITGNGPDGKSRVLADGAAPRTTDFKSVPGFSPTLLWSTNGGAKVGRSGVDDVTPTATWTPGAGGTRLMIVTFPPDAVMMRADFDPAAFGAEFGGAMPGLAETFEMDSPGMHTTDSIDYDVVLDGEITLELDDGQEVLLKRSDVVVQHGNRHAWRNKSHAPAVMLFVLVGAERAA